MPEYTFEEFLQQVEADLKQKTAETGDPMRSRQSFDEFLDLALAEEEYDSVLDEKDTAGPSLGPLGALGLGMVDNPLSRLVTRPVYGGIEMLERTIADIRGKEREDRRIPPLDEPLVDTKELTPLERNWQIAGEVMGTGLPLVKVPEKMGRAVTSTVRGGRQRVTTSDFDFVRTARAIRRDPAVPEGLKPSRATAGGAYPEWLFPIMETAATKPKTYTTAEIGSILGSAQGAAIANELNPEDELTRFGGEVIGGAINPVMLGVRTITSGSSAAKNLFKFFTKAGRQDAVASMYSKLLKEAGEDPEEIIAALERGASVKVDNLTAGQVTGSPTMLAVENKLAERSAEYAGRRKDDTKKALQSLREMADSLSASGDPRDLRRASIVRRTYFDELLNSRVSDARQSLVARVRAAMPSGELMSPGDLNRMRGESSRRVYEILHDSVQQARNIQTELWDQIPTDVPMPAASSLREAVKNVTRDMPQESRLPFQKTIERLTSGGGGTAEEWTSKSGDFVGLAKDLGDEARRLRAAEDYRGAWRARSLREAVLEDLSNSPIPGPAYQAARDYTDTMKDTFSRTFVGDALATNRRGATRINPEDVLDIAFNPNSALARDRRFREMVDVGEFFNNIYGFDTEIGSSILFEQETYLRTLADRFTDRAGNVDYNKLVNFVDQNQNIISRFPQLQRHLSDAESAAQYLNRVERAAEYVSKDVLSRAAFSNIVGAETPVVVVRRVLDGPNPFRDYRSMARTARDADRVAGRTAAKNEAVDSRAALEGLKATTLDYAFDKASNTNGTSFIRLQQELDMPIARGEPSLIETMIDERVMSREEADRLRDIISTGVQAERALKDPHRIDELMGEQRSPFWDFAVSWIGARITTKAFNAGGGRGSGIIIAGRGAGLARNFASDLPAERHVDVIMEMSRNPQMLADAMKRTTSYKERIELSRRLNAYLVNAGLPKSSDLQDSTIPEIWSDDEEATEESNFQQELENYLNSL